MNGLFNLILQIKKLSLIDVRLDLTRFLKYLYLLGLGGLWELEKDREAWHAAIHGVTESDITEQRNNKI